MATCPKCGHKLKLTDWKPECPECGVNIVYYGMEERLLDDADSAEAEHARFQQKLDRLKASFIGSKLTIARIVLSLLPIGALFIPLAKISYCGPFLEDKVVNVDALKIYDFVSNLNFDALFELIGSDIVGKGFLLFFLSIVFTLLSVVLIIVSLVCLVGACGPKATPRNLTLNGLMFVFGLVGIILFSISAGQLSAVFPAFYSASLGAGAFVYLAAVLALLGINLIIAQKGIDVKYKPCYVGGIEYHEYTEMVENGVPIEEIREKMGVALEEKAIADEIAAAEKAAAKEAKKNAKGKK